MRRIRLPISGETWTLPLLPFTWSTWKHIHVWKILLWKTRQLLACLKGLIPPVFKAVAAHCVRVLGNLVRERLSASNLKLRKGGNTDLLPKKQIFYLRNRKFAHTCFQTRVFQGVCERQRAEKQCLLGRQDFLNRNTFTWWIKHQTCTANPVFLKV